MDSNEERYVVFSDLHGRAGLLEACYKRYGNTVMYISGGDAIDAPEHGNVKTTIELLQNIGAVCLYGNHEWVLGAAMHNPDEYSRKAWSYTWSGYHRGVLGSYGLQEPSPVKSYKDFNYMSAALELKDAITGAGHMQFFDNLKPYVEASDFIVVHGGLTHDTWDGKRGQKSELDSVSGPTKSAARTRRQWDSEPVQIFDPHYTLSTRLVLPHGPAKKVITGHAHSSESSITRVTDNGKRIRLAGPVTEGAPLYMYESWTGGVVPIYQ